MALIILFYVFAIIAAVSGLMVITARNPVRAVLFLVMAFVAMSGTWMLLQAEFLSLVLIVVYVGAVMVLFLFVVMMLDVDRVSVKSGFVRYWPLVVLVGCGLFTFLILFSIDDGRSMAAPLPITHTWVLSQSNIQQVGMNIFTLQLYPFELAAVILLAAMIAAISLTFRGRTKSDRAQVIARQVRVKVKDRLKLIDMPSETKK